MDENEAFVIDAATPLGNIGFPSGVEGELQLAKMLRETCVHLTAAEIDELVGSLAVGLARLRDGKLRSRHKGL